jgi:predicted ABC-type ATPase
MKQAFMIAGPNGSGKTVLAKELIKELGLPFMNADEIALTLAPACDIAKVRVKAGKLFLSELTDYIRKGRSFAVETTLAGRNFTEIIKKMQKRGYEIMLIYVFVENWREAVDRIKLRVAKG